MIPSELTERDNKYSIVPPATPTNPNSAGIYQDGTDFCYFLQIGIGSAGKPMFMLLDTGAGTTWVMGSNCGTDACAMHNSFGPKDSTTYTQTSKTFSISYGTGKVAGDLAQDKFAVGGLDVSMTFGVANETSSDFTHFPFDGILGMSMSNGATDNFLKVMKDSKKLASTTFAVSLSRSKDGSNTGEVTLGGVDPSKFTGNLGYTTVSDKAGGDWAIPMDDFAYDGKKAGVTGRLTYIDTGTTYNFGPPEDVAALHKLIPGAQSADGGLTYTVPCDSTKVLSVSFSGVAYTISPADWMSPPSGDTCTSNFYGQAVVEGAWLLGDTFIKNVYAVFDVDKTRIGFAAKPASESTSVKTPATTSSTEATPSSTASSQGSASSPLTTISPVAPVTGSSAAASPMPGLSGHETSSTVDAPTAQTAVSSATPTATASSPGDQLHGTRYSAIICIVAVIAIVS